MVYLVLCSVDEWMQEKRARFARFPSRHWRRNRHAGSHARVADGRQKKAGKAAFRELRALAA
jgi:hypothetical protein